MPTVSINHLTRYRYRDEVSFGEHRILVRPRESYDQRLLSADLVIDPEPDALRWIQDVFGNAVAIASFSGRADYLEVRGTAEVEHLPTAEADITVEPYAEFYPFTYASEDMPDLLRSIERDYRDGDRRLDRWASGFLDNGGPMRTLDLLRRITEHISHSFAYNRREEKGIQSPLETLDKGSGTCRDYAVLMMETVRALGLAARFVTGYLYDEEHSEARVGGHSTHAWVRVFLPGSGWVEFDPTNGIVGNNGLIRVAVARDPRQALPLTGTWTGPVGSELDMEVSVEIERRDIATSHAGFPVKEHSEC